MPHAVRRKPIVSVIIVSYNTASLTLRSVQSAYASKGFKKGEIEVIVVDNNSTDDTVNYLGSQLENFRLIVNSENKGFGAANNQGAAIAKGKYLLLLNSDAFLDTNALRAMVDTLSLHRDIYSTGPLLRTEDDTTSPSSGYFPTPSRIIGWMWGLDKLPLIKLAFPTPYHVFDLNWYGHEQYPDWLMGACVLFRTSEFKSVGGFDEQIFMYAEEVDLYQRLHAKLRKKVFFNPLVSAIHLGHSSSQSGDAAYLTHELRGILYLYTKRYSHLLWIIRFIIYTGVLMRVAIFSLIPSRRDSVLEYKKLL